MDGTEIANAFLRATQMKHTMNLLMEEESCHTLHSPAVLSFGFIVLSRVEGPTAQIFSF